MFAKIANSLGRFGQAVALQLVVTACWQLIDRILTYVTDRKAATA